MKARVFYGEPETGKSRKAEEIARKLNEGDVYGEKCVIFDGRTFKINRPFQFKYLSDKIELIIIDDVPKKFDWNQLFYLISSDELIVEKRGQNPIFIKTPEIIITTNEKPKLCGLSSFDRRFECIEFTK